MAKIRVFVVDDHSMLRTALCVLIDSQADMNVIGEATCVQDAIERASHLHADLVVIDMCSPSGTGINRIRQWRAACPRTKVLALNMHDDPAYFRSAIAAGAMGYVAKSEVNEELVETIRAVHYGWSPVTQGDVVQSKVFQN